MVETLWGGHLGHPHSMYSCVCGFSLEGGTVRGLGNRCLAFSRDSYNTSEGVTAMTHARAPKARPPGRIVDGVAVVDTGFE